MYNWWDKCSGFFTDGEGSDVENCNGLLFLASLPEHLSTLKHDLLVLWSMVGVCNERSAR